MALTLNSELCKETSNSYVDIPYADDYFEGHYITSYTTQWDALSDAQKTKLLIRACFVLEQCRFTNRTYQTIPNMRYDVRSGSIFLGFNSDDVTKLVDYQRLQFPRNLDLYYMDAPDGSQPGQEYIPEPMKMAQCEQAIYTLNLDQTPLANRLMGITMDKVNLGNNAIATTQQYSVNGSSLAPAAYELISQFFLRNGQIQRG